MGKDHKKHKKKKHKKEKKKKRNSTSESSEGDEWVEKDDPKSRKLDESENSVKCENSSSKNDSINERGDWMDMSDQLFSTITKADLRDKKSRELKDEKKSTIEELGQSDRELNPYWKDGGSGLPSSNRDGDRQMGSTGDMGLDWLKRALARIKERAAEENKSLEEIASQTWGSLDKLYNLINEAEKKRTDQKQDRYKDRYTKSDKFAKDDSRHRDYKKSYKDDVRERQFSRFKRPDDDDYDSNIKKHGECKNEEREMKAISRSSHFKKPRDDCFDVEKSNIISQKPTRDFSSNKSSSLSGSYASSVKSSGWKRDQKQLSSSTENDDTSSTSDVSKKLDTMEHEKVVEKKPENVVEEKPEILTKEEMNKLGAQIIKAEMMGNEEKALQLKEKLAKAQAWLSGNKPDAETSREVILTTTDAKGFTRPVNATETKHSKAKRSKVETHSDGKRVRYFADDDKHSLNELFQKEKFVSAADENEIYSRLAAKGVGKDDSHRDMEDVFEETARVDRGDEWYEFKERQRAVLENDKREKALDKCQWCIGAGNLNRHLVVSVMEKVYLTVPPFGSITEGHCLIIPNHHTPCSTLLDEDVWQEVMDLRKILVNMFLEDEKDVLFYENVQYFRKFPHMVLHCVPVPKETGDVAPIYFKKAIMECEMEWSNNKKVVELKGRDVRKAVPKGLPYFFVDFGMQSGYAHVIEDEQLFPKNFAEEIIGGMMDLDHHRWRKQKKDDPEVLQKKAQTLIKRFKSYMDKK